MRRMPSVLIICVDYESQNETIKYIKSIAEANQENATISVVLVDNSESPGRELYFADLKQIYPTLHCLKSPYNLGYFGGAHFGLNRYLEKNELPDWIIVSNVDLYFDDITFFDSLVEHRFPVDIGVVAPSIWSNHWKMDRNPKMVMRPRARTIRRYVYLYRSSLLANVYQMLGRMKSSLRRKSGFYIPRVLQTMMKPSEDPGGLHFENSPGVSTPIYAPHGSFIVFSRKYFESGGNIDYPCFLFMEEIYVAEEARRLNLEVVYTPSLRVIHNDHVSTGIFRSPRMTRHMYESALYIANAFFD